MLPWLLGAIQDMVITFTTLHETWPGYCLSPKVSAHLTSRATADCKAPLFKKFLTVPKRQNSALNILFIQQQNTVNV